jgi:hypothetical protein
MLVKLSENENKRTEWATTKILYEEENRFTRKLKESAVIRTTKQSSVSLAQT